MIENRYLLISPILLIVSEQNIDFNIYLFNENKFILYATPQNFTEKHRERLVCNEIKNIYINRNDKIAYDLFVQANLPLILDSEKLNLQKKSEILYNHSLYVVEDFYKNLNSDNLNREGIDKLISIVDNIYSFFSKNQNAIQFIQNLVQVNYNEYIHCINTSLYAISFLSHYNREKNEVNLFRKSTIRNIGIGALLHDIGKSKIQHKILMKPGALSTFEFDEIKKHPIYGIEMCQYMELEQSVSQCVLFHHEKLDGSGYPTGTKNIHRHVQIVTVADMFDAITCERPYRKHKVTTFEALKILSKEVERGRLDRELVASFVRMISQDVIRL